MREDTVRETVSIDGAAIVDWATFHHVFAAALGFPASYGRNMDAWIDCMSYLGDIEEGMTQVHAPAGGVVTLVLGNARSFKARCPEQWAAMIECSAFVNWRLLERGKPAVLALAFYV